MERTLEISVRDDGKGGADPRGGSGLLGLKDRVGALYGDITIASPPDMGTTVEVAIPLTTPQAEHI